jgi:hypothetical protein
LYIPDIFQSLDYMFYIHQATCISPQHTFLKYDLESLKIYDENKLHAVEPVYDGIPTSLLRRMGKAVRLGIGAAMPLIKDNIKINGIVIGTANGGLEDCIKFLNQIVQYQEGTLTPTNFVQSTANAIASQIAMLSSNNGYNITHVHRGLAFENAVIDVMMLVNENPEFSYLLGGVGEISEYNYNIEYLGGWFKKEMISNQNLYSSNSVGTISGEGSAMFLVNGIKENAKLQFDAVRTFNSKNENVIANELKRFIDENVGQGEKIDLFLSGENGDSRLNRYFTKCESVIGDKVSVARYKHMTGEFETASALSLWLAMHAIREQNLPEHMLKGKLVDREINKILIYNTGKGSQHSFMLVSKI